MKKGERLNLFNLYSEMIKFNIKSLAKLIEINQKFIDFAYQMHNTEREMVSELESQNINTEKMDFNKDQKIEHAREITDDLEVYNLGPIASDESEPVEALDDMAAAKLLDRPITMLENLTPEIAELLNLHGVHTYGDLEVNNLTELSRSTGITRTQLYNLRRQVL